MNEIKRIWIAFGANIDNPLQQLFKARLALSQVQGLEEEAKSSIYRSQPWGYKEQPDFYNAVICYRTELVPQEILRICQEQEHLQGRVRSFANAPRPLDLDLLLYGEKGELLINSPELIIPHPYIKQRAFVLEPLREISPWLMLEGESIGKCCAELGSEGLEKLASFA